MQIIWEPKNQPAQLFGAWKGQRGHSRGAGWGITSNMERHWLLRDDVQKHQTMAEQEQTDFEFFQFFLLTTAETVWNTAWESRFKVYIVISLINLMHIPRISVFPKFDTEVYVAKRRMWLVSDVSSSTFIKL